MSTTAPPVTSVPEPVQAVEAQAEAAVPSAVRPEVEAIKQELNAQAIALANQGAAQQGVFDQADPNAATLAKDAANMFEGKSVPLSGVLTAGAGFMKEARRGYKTTEFWLVLAGVVLTQLGAINVPGKYGTTIQDSALIASYAISRGLAKKP